MGPGSSTEAREDNMAAVPVHQDDLEGGRPQPQQSNRKIPEFLLNDTLRLFLLRAVVASSLMSSGFAIYGAKVLAKTNKPSLRWIVPYAVFCPLTSIHHLGAAFGRHRFSVPRTLDIAWTFIEFVAYVVAIGYTTKYSNLLGAEYFPRYGVAALVGIWGLFLSVFFLLIVKIVYCINSHSPHPFVAGTEQSGLWKTAGRSLFGRRLWGQGIRGEPQWITWVRGILALLAVCALVGYGVYQAIMMPIAERGKIPYRIYRSDGVDWETTHDILPKVQYRLLLLWSTRPGALADIAQAAVVTASFRSLPLEQSRFNCSISPAGLEKLDPAPWDLGIVRCPQTPKPSNPPSPFQDFPNFDISVNFRALLGSDPLSVDRVSNSVRVYLGFTNHVDKVYAKTEPVSLFPGVHLLSVAKLDIMQTLIPASLGTFGLESYENYLVASIVQTIPNPFVEAASDPGVGTLGFTVQTATGGWTTLQDYRSKSVLSGLSALGGLGSLFSAVLALLVGTTLVQAVFRTRPNNPFGFLHGSDGLRDAYQRIYPKLGDDVRRYRENQGLPNYVIDTLIDIEPLVQSASGTGPSVTQVQHLHEGKDDEASGPGERE